MAEQTPLYSALIREALKNTLRMHMPGHKGKALKSFRYSDIFEIDFTELAATGNLYEGVPPISDAEELMAKAASAKDCFFLTGGATQGIMTAMAAACPPGGSVVIDRASHRSVWSAMVHLDLRPSYLYTERLAPYEIAAPITADEVEAELVKTPDASAVVITSPSYYGVLSDISGISKVTKQHGVPLIVDEAHGAHLPFVRGCRGAVALGASLSVASAHKTLPALTAGAFLFSAGEYEPREIRRKAALFGTSSPSYAVMASMDAARAYMEGEGGARYNRIATLTKKLRRKINEAGIFHALSEESSLCLDPTRLTVCTAEAGISGHAAAGLLESDYGIVCEMADSKNIVMIITCADTEEDLDRIFAALSDLGARQEAESESKAAVKAANSGPGSVSGANSNALKNIHPVQRMLPREAAYAPRKYVRLADAAGMTAGEHIAPYPPGIPVIAAGEEINAVLLAHLQSIGFNVEKIIAVLT